MKALSHALLLLSAGLGLGGSRAVCARPVAAASGRELAACGKGPVDDAVARGRAATEYDFVLHGLNAAATVSDAVTVSLAATSAGGAAASPITVCLRREDDGSAALSNSMRGDGTPRTLSLAGVLPGRYWLEGISARGLTPVFKPLPLVIVAGVGSQFSPSLTPYAPQPSAARPLAQILERTATPTAALTAEESEVRRQVAAMYQDLGYDLSLDAASDQSTVLAALLPSGWAPPTSSKDDPYSLQFSPDAIFYHPLPAAWPRVRLPAHYLSSIQLNTNQGGDGIGYGVAVAGARVPTHTIISQWYAQQATRRSIAFPLPADWRAGLPSLVEGDSHMIFLDTASRTFVSAYKTTADPATTDPRALYASSPTPLDSLGDRGGSDAAGFAELPLLLWPGEATTDPGEIRHALGGPVARPWAARVYPATAWDANVRTSANSCEGKQALATNTGLVPYGGIIQLDPSLDLSRLTLSTPARRILRALQVYGYYVMDFGCSDLDIYTAISERELMPYGGLYGNGRPGSGVQGEIGRVLASAALFVVPPPLKRGEPTVSANRVKVGMQSSTKTTPLGR